MAFNLSSLDTASVAERGAVMTVLHPTTGVALAQSDGSPVTLILSGEDSERFRRADRANRNKRLARQQQGRQIRVSTEELDAESLGLLVAVTLGWSGVALDGDTDLVFSAENATKLYTSFPWLREQANAFVVDRANFLGK